MPSPDFPHATKSTSARLQTAQAVTAGGRREDQFQAGRSTAGWEEFVPPAPASFLAHLSLWQVFHLADPGKHGFINKKSVKEQCLEGVSDIPGPVWALL